MRQTTQAQDQFEALAAERERLLVSERHARQHADEERRVLLTILEGVEHGITQQDQTGKLTFANASAARTIGFNSPEELLATPLAEVMKRFEVFAPDGSPFPLERLPARAVFAGQASEPVVLRYRTRDSGEERWSRVSAQGIFDSSGRAVSVINVFRDVTHERRGELQRELLLGAVEQFNSSLDYRATLAAVARQVVPTIADWSAVDILEEQEFKRLAVAHVDPLKLKLVEEIERRYPSDPRAPGGPRQVLASQKPFLLSSIPAPMLRAGARDAEHLTMIEQLSLRSYMAVPLIGRTGPIGVLTLATAESGRNYTESDLRFACELADRAALAIENARLFRDSERGLAQEKNARGDAERTSRFMEMFVGILGHDLRNPLNAIGIGAQSLLRRASDDAQRRVATRISTSTERMARMVDQLLDLTRIRVGQGLSLEPSLVDLAEMARQISDETEAALSCAITLERRGPMVGVWDPDRLGQVLSNLLSNAVKHGQAGTPVTVALDGTQQRAVTIEVRNRGSIAEEILPTMFDPFREGAPRQAGSRGLGLGLYITREIVHAHRGSIEAASAGENTIFRVQLPREQGAR